MFDFLYKFIEVIFKNVVFFSTNKKTGLKSIRKKHWLKSHMSMVKIHETSIKKFLKFL